MIALQQVVAFPEGCVLALRLAVRRGSLATPVWEGVLADHSGVSPTSQ